jgi:hypothetical protein
MNAADAAAARLMGATKEPRFDVLVYGWSGETFVRASNRTIEWANQAAEWAARDGWEVALARSDSPFSITGLVPGENGLVRTHPPLRMGR